MRRVGGLVVTCACLALFPATASAETFYASDSGSGPSPCAQATPCSLPAAVNAANLDAGEDAVEIQGALTHALDSEGPIGLTDGTDLIGSGRGAGGTLIRDPAGNNQFAIGEGSVASNLAAGSDTSATAIQMSQGSTLQQADVDLDPAAGANGINTTPFGGTSPPDRVIDDVDISDGGSGMSEGIKAQGGTGRTIVSDSTINARRGVFAEGGFNQDTDERLIVRRTTIAAEITGMRVFQSSLRASSSVVYRRPSTSTNFQGIVVGNSANYNGATSDAELRQLTVDGDTSFNSGVSVFVGGGSGTGGTSSATVRGSIVRSFGSDLSCGSSASLDVGDSNFSSSQTTGCTFTNSGGNVDVDPAYVNEAGRDYHLGSSSPMIDAAGTNGPVGDESTTDFEGDPRVTDGNADGQAKRDIGADETAGTVAPPDRDGDGIADSTDNCPDNANAGQTDTDTDGRGDACDEDDDGDGENDAQDNCQLVANPGQQNNDGDAEGDVCDSDDDNDGVNDGSDNCPNASNGNQANNDGDAEGDACDSDDDNDGVNDGSDNCPNASNGNQENNDSDGQGDACDPDDDNDQKPDSNDACPTEAAGSASGCPKVARDLTLRYSGGSDAFKGELSADRGACERGQAVTVFRKRDGDDKVLGTDDTNSNGRYEVPDPGKGGRYYSKAAREVIPSVGKCASARSDELELD